MQMYWENENVDKKRIKMMRGYKINFHILNDYISIQFCFSKLWLLILTDAAPKIAEFTMTKSWRLNRRYWVFVHLIYIAQFWH